MLKTDKVTNELQLWNSEGNQRLTWQILRNYSYFLNFFILL